jgi:hypothetical protein
MEVRIWIKSLHGFHFYVIYGMCYLLIYHHFRPQSRFLIHSSTRSRLHVHQHFYDFLCMTVAAACPVSVHQMKKN